MNQKGGLRYRLYRHIQWNITNERNFEFVINQRNTQSTAITSIFLVISIDAT